MLQATGYPAEIADFYSAIAAGYWGVFVVAKVVRLVMTICYVSSICEQLYIYLWEAKSDKVLEARRFVAFSFFLLRRTISFHKADLDSELINVVLFVMEDAMRSTLTFLVVLTFYSGGTQAGKSYI